MRAAVAFLFLVPILAGCLQGDSDAPDEPQPAPAASPPAEFDGGRFRVEVPVPVFLFGFAEGTADALQERLPELRPDAEVYNNARLLSGNLLGGTNARANPMDPTAVYAYHELSAAPLVAAMDGLSLQEGLINATAMDDLIAAEINAAGFILHAGRPGVVLLHLGDGGHAYRIEYPTGHVDGVRAFGERHAYTVLDVSARVDSYVGTTHSFNSPVPQEGAEATLAEAVAYATWFRTMQGPIYPQATTPCHAITLLVAYRASTISQTLPSYTKAADLLDVEYLTAAWESLLGVGRVHVDSTVLALPLDDPALDAVLRERQNEALRVYMDENWADYHVAHDGCEPYLSVFLIGDAGDSGVSGIAMYDVDDNRRISMSWMNDLTMFQEEDGEVSPLYVDDESRYSTNWVNFLFSHESGHLFGQRHPHDASASGAPRGSMTFASIWSAMSYQQDGKMPLFGAIDQNNYWRNRAGFLGEAAAMAGHEEDPVFTQALQLMGSQEWMEAGDLLLPLQP